MCERTAASNVCQKSLKLTLLFLFVPEQVLPGQKQQVRKQLADIEHRFNTEARGQNTKRETTNREALSKHVRECLRDRHLNICFVRRI